MTDPTDDLLTFLRPTAAKPLLGQTILAVEDSRFAGEALRLMLQKCGARCRRADSLGAAARHLKTYRPSIVIVDLGLPDGSGLRLLDTLAQARSHGPGPALVATSGDPDSQPAALDAGADAFLDKPVASLGALQTTLLSVLPEDIRPLGPRDVPQSSPSQDPQALADDLAHIADLLSSAEVDGTTDYIAGFAAGLGRCAGDAQLTFSAERLRDAMRSEQPFAQKLATLAGLVQQRLKQVNLV